MFKVRLVTFAKSRKQASLAFVRHEKKISTPTLEDSCMIVSYHSKFIELKKTDFQFPFFQYFHEEKNAPGTRSETTRMFMFFSFFVGKFNTKKENPNDVIQESEEKTFITF